MDRGELFLHPVNKAEVPDYFNVIKEPMCWLFIDEKLEKNEYLRVAAFKVIVYVIEPSRLLQRDINLVLDNAMLYNKGDSPFHRTAKRIKANAQPLLEDLDQITTQSLFALPTEVNAALAPNAGSPHESASGDLEPPPLLLQLLLEISRNDESRDHLASIFMYELEKPKPPTPPPPTPPPPKSRKYMSATERKQRWEEREAAAKERAVAGRSTRALKAMAGAFAEEAGVQPSSDAEPAVPSAVPSSPPLHTSNGRRKSMREGAPSTVLAERSEGSIRQPSRPQRGVAGVEAVAILSDKERREMERQMDIVTEEVDSQDQFKRFNVGWVLPEGSKRRRSERPPEPGPSRPAAGE